MPIQLRTHFCALRFFLCCCCFRLHNIAVRTKKKKHRLERNSLRPLCCRHELFANTLGAPVKLGRHASKHTTQHTSRGQRLIDILIHSCATPAGSLSGTVHTHTPRLYVLFETSAIQPASQPEPEQHHHPAVAESLHSRFPPQNNLLELVFIIRSVCPRRAVGATFFVRADVVGGGGGGERG